MNYEELSEFAMQIIANSGMSRSASMEAVKFAREGEFEKCKQSLEEANNFYLEAHKTQTELIVKETGEEEKIVLNLIMVHAQDHLTMALMAKDNAKEMINVYERLSKLEAK